ncbi:uncharacterized protein K444DRAFT_620568 [Hyaloscypha bicolor E]|uniref:Uncharacterized protein n=1 Tax=Hyaloscypha bicolor E TaxID=1095630 RepID=A0A2J6SL28_9HELO|nr:uncharacterized protein K444DRAFT_620568 [Hyaloscypha bicolor E]PMD51457.1 hypothetical protein K444DRAFT_620568 [Hyaloscypha bicolor E]
MSHDSHLHLPKSQSTKASLPWVLLHINPHDPSPSAPLHPTAEAAPLSPLSTPSR